MKVNNERIKSMYMRVKKYLSNICPTAFNELIKKKSVDNNLISKDNLVLALLVIIIMWTLAFPWQIRMNIFGVNNIISSICIILLLIFCTNKLNKVILLFVCILSVSYILTSFTYEKDLGNIFIFFNSFIIPLIIIGFNIEKGIFQKFLKIFIYILNLIIFIIIPLGLIEVVFDVNIFLKISHLLSPPMETMMYRQQQNDVYRLYTFMGHPLFNAQLILIFYIINNIYDKYFKRGIPQLFLIIISLLGIAMTASKSAMIMLIGAMIICNYDYFKKMNIKKILFLLSAMIITVCSGIFNSIIYRIINEGFSTGRSNAWKRVLDSGLYPLKIFTGYGMGFTFEFNSYLDHASAAFEYPFRMFSLEYGIFITVTIYIIIFIIPALKLIKNKDIYLLLCYLVIFTHVNTYNGLSLQGDYMLILVLILFIILNLSNLDSKSKNVEDKKDEKSMKKKMKIAFLSHNIFSQGGVQRVVTTLSNLLISDFEIDIICTNTKIPINREIYKLSENVNIIYNDIEIDNKFKIFFLRSIRLLNKKFGILNNRYFINLLTYVYYPKKQQQKLINLINTNKYDYIIGCEGYYSILLGIINKKINTKTIGWHHNTFEAYFQTKNKYYWNRDKLADKYLKRLDKLVVLTNQDFNKYYEYFNISPEVIYNPISFISTIKSQLIEKNIIAMGRLTEQKGFDLLIEAFNKIENKDEWNLKIIGCGEEKLNLINLIESYNLNEKVSIHDFTHDVISEYQKGSIYAMSSRWEGFGLVVTEALEMGLPVVSFDLDGPTEILGNGDYGIIIEKNNIDKLAESLNHLMHNEDFRRRLSDKSLERAKSFYGEVIIKQWIQLLKEI